MAMGEGVTAVAAPEATFSISRSALHPGAEADRTAVRAAMTSSDPFPGWRITDAEVADTAPDLISRLFGFDTQRSTGPRRV